MPQQTNRGEALRAIEDWKTSRTPPKIQTAAAFGF